MVGFEDLSGGDVMSMRETDSQRTERLNREVDRWRESAQELNSALQEVWRAVVPDTDGRAFTSTQQAVEDIILSLPKQSVLDVAEERSRQPRLGWTAEHDAEHGFGHLIRLAQDRLSRAYNAGDAEDLDSARHEMVKAAALLVAGIDLIDAQDEGD